MHVQVHNDECFTNFTWQTFILTDTIETLENYIARKRIHRVL